MQSGRRARLTIGLTVATLQESITVTGAAPLIETTKTEQGSQLNSNEILNLPTTSRSYLALAQLSPGVVSQGGGFSASGSRNTQNNFNVDGMSNKNLNGGGDFGRVSPEGIQEFNVVTQSYPAEYGGATGGVTNAVSKSGTNVFTGYGFWYQRHNAFDRPPFNTRARADGTVEAFPVAEANFARRYVRGFTLGGPILRDRAFFFGVLDVTNQPSQTSPNAEQDNSINVMRTFLPDLPDTLDNGATDFKNWDATSNVKVDYNLSPQNTLDVHWRHLPQLQPGRLGERSQLGLHDDRTEEHDESNRWLAEFGAVRPIAEHLPRPVLPQRSAHEVPESRGVRERRTTGSLAS